MFSINVHTFDNGRLITNKLTSFQIQDVPTFSGTEMPCCWLKEICSKAIGFCSNTISTQIFNCQHDFSVPEIWAHGRFGKEVNLLGIKLSLSKSVGYL